MQHTCRGLHTSAKITARAASKCIQGSRAMPYWPHWSITGVIFARNDRYRTPCSQITPNLAEALVCRLDSRFKGNLSERFRKWQHVNIADFLNGFFPFQTMGFAKLVRVESLRKPLKNLM